MLVEFPVYGIRKLPKEIKQAQLTARIALPDIIPKTEKKVDEEGKEIIEPFVNPYYTT